MHMDNTQNQGLVLFPLEGDNKNYKPPGSNASKSIKSVVKKVVLPKTTPKSFKWRYLLFLFILYFLYKRYVSQTTDEGQNIVQNEKSAVENFSRYSLNANTYNLNVRNAPSINSKVVSILTKESVFYGRQSTNVKWTEIYDEGGSMVGFARTKHLTLVH
ncbi:MAG: hypothetical protein FJY17_06860 [Bacteroidetes bacterium]|nr:hypothetical protein [Bacteroidota bacterium]